MKILIVIPSLKGGGAEHVTTLWAATLVGLGHCITIAVSTDLSGVTGPPGVRVVSLGARGQNITHVLKLRTLVRRGDFDVVMSILTYGNILASVSRIMGAHAPLVVSERNIFSITDDKVRLSLRVQRLIARQLYARADHGMAISHAVAAEMVSYLGMDADRVTVIPNPSALPVPSRKLHSRRRQAHGAVLDIVLPCRLVPQKRPTIAFDAVSILTDRGIETHLHVFGDGPLRPSMERRAARDGITATFHGWRDSWFESAPERAVVLLPSLREGFGNVLIEAASKGLPVVTSSRALGVSDAVLPGLSGILIPFDQPADYAEAIVTAAALDLSSIGPWLDRFTPEQSSDMLVKLLERVVNDAE